MANRMHHLVVSTNDLIKIISGLGCTLDYDNCSEEEEAATKHLITWLEERADNDGN